MEIDYNILGLSLGIVGVIILFYSGLPGPEGDVMETEDAPGEEEKKQTRQNLRIWSYGGLGLLILGFALQILGRYN